MAKKKKTEPKKEPKTIERGSDEDLIAMYCQVIGRGQVQGEAFIKSFKDDERKRFAECRLHTGSVDIVKFNQFQNRYHDDRKAVVDAARDAE